MILSRLILCGALASLAGAAEADQGRAPPIWKGPAVSIQAYGSQNPRCTVWTNGCVICRTNVAGGSACSLPGIACQPAGITCKALRPE